MARTVDKIIEDDKDKAELGVDQDENLIDGNEEVVVEDKNPTPEEVAADLRKQLEVSNARADREAAAREEAEKRAGTSAAAAGSAVQSQIATHEVAISNRIVAATANYESVKQQLKQAKAAGDTDSEVELTSALNRADIELDKADAEKKNFEQWKKAQANKPVQTEASTPAYTAKEQIWIKEHPEFNSNERFARLAKSAAGEARGEGIAQDSKAYFQYIEDALRLKGLIKDDGEESPLSGAGRNINASVGAAPNRSGNGATPVVNKNSKYPHVPNGFRIPADWVQASQDQGFEDPREYANERLKIEAEEKGRA